MNTTTKSPPPRVKVTPHTLPQRQPGQADEPYEVIGRNQHSRWKARFRQAILRGPSNEQLEVIEHILCKMAMYDIDLTDDQRRTLLAMGGVE